MRQCVGDFKAAKRRPPAPSPIGRRLACRELVERGEEIHYTQIMNSLDSFSLDPDQLAALAALANGIIPADELDAGAAEVNAAGKIAERIANGINASLYQQGLATAEALARERYNRSVAQLTAAEIHDLLAAVRDHLPAFFKQLRLDITAHYLSDPGVWQRIGFPGPSTVAGGYPDFDQPQIERPC
jgi:hypothetical protein